MRTKPLQIIFCIILPVHFCLGQCDKKRIDSLKGFITNNQWEQANLLAHSIYHEFEAGINGNDSCYACYLGKIHALLYERTEQYDSARYFYEGAIKKFNNLPHPDSNCLFTVKSQYANLLIQTEDYPQANEMMLDAYRMMDKLKVTSDEKIKVTIGLANTYSFTNDRNTAEKLYMSVDPLIKNSLPTTKMEYYLTKSGFYQILHSSIKSLYYAKEALKVSAYFPKRPEFFIANLYMGNSFYISEKYDSALKYFNICDSLIIKTNNNFNPSNYLIVARCTGDTYRQLNQPELAEKKLLAAIDTFRRYSGYSGRYYEMSLLESLMYFYWQQGEHGKLANVVDSSLTLYRQFPNYSKIYTLPVKFREWLLLEQKRYREALPLTDSLQNYYLSNINKVYHYQTEYEKADYITRLWETGSSYLSALAFSDIPKDSLMNKAFSGSSTLKGMLVSDLSAQFSQIDSSGDTAIKKLYAKWRINNLVINRLYLKPGNEQAADSLAAENSSIERQLFSYSGISVQQQLIPEVNISAIQQKLQPKQVYIEMMRFALPKKGSLDIHYGAFVITKHTAGFSYLCPEARLLQLIKKFCGKEENCDLTQFYTKLATRSKKEAVDRFMQLIWSPLSRHIQKGSTIFLVPDGIIHRFSLPGLTYHNRLLADDFTFRYMSSSRSFINRQELYVNQISKSAFFADIDYGKEYKDSAWKALSAFKSYRNQWKKRFEHEGIKTNVFTRKEATEQNFLAAIDRQPELLYISTHGYTTFRSTNTFTELIPQNETYFSAKSPLLQTGLVFAGANKLWQDRGDIAATQDGMLTGYEIMHLPLYHTRLAILHGCETGTGQYNPFEGVAGLQLAFRMAGVQKIIYSLWKAEDNQSHEFFDTLFRYWSGKVSLQQAFIKTQEKLRREKKFTPYFWAGFVLME